MYNNYSQGVVVRVSKTLTSFLYLSSYYCISLSPSTFLRREVFVFCLGFSFIPLMPGEASGLTKGSDQPSHVGYALCWLMCMPFLVVSMSNMFCVIFLKVYTFFSSQRRMRYFKQLKLRAFLPQHKLYNQTYFSLSFPPGEKNQAKASSASQFPLTSLPDNCLSRNTGVCHFWFLLVTGKQQQLERKFLPTIQL